MSHDPIDKDQDAFETYLESTLAPASPHYNSRQLQSWLHTCISDHSNCSEFQQRSTGTTERPSRILEIGEHCVKLRCDLPSQDVFPYVTLSHMWGLDATHQLTLNESNMDEYRKGIPVELLPAIYKEACHLTRLLDLKYLWIDALCILQDSSSDWRHEASRMASVYGHALCNLACLLPPDKFDPQRRMDPRSCLPCVIEAATPNNGGGVYAYRDDACLDPYQLGTEYDWHEPTKWPLFSRAWYVQ